MELSGKKIRKEKLKQLKENMESSLKGCRKIAIEFNREMKEKGETIRVGKTTVHEIMKEMGMYLRGEEKKLDGHLTRPPAPFMEFTMDFTEKVIAGGEMLMQLFVLLENLAMKLGLEGLQSQLTTERNSRTRMYWITAQSMASFLIS